MLRRSVQELIAYRELLWALTYRDIRVKYKQAVMGITWAFFLPLLAIFSGIIFRAAMSFFKNGQSPELADIVMVMIKVVPWLLFAAIVGSASNSLVANINLITKIYFPRSIVPLSGALSALFDFTISALGLSVVLLLIGMTTDSLVATVQMLWIPVLLAVLVILAVGLGLMLSAANLFYRDVKYIVQVILQFGVFFSLVFFTYEEIPFGWVLLLNPVTPLLEGVQSILLTGRIDPELWPYLGLSVVVAIGCLLVGAWTFDKAEYLFAEYA